MRRGKVTNLFAWSAPLFATLMKSGPCVNRICKFLARFRGSVGRAPRVPKIEGSLQLSRVSEINLFSRCCESRSACSTRRDPGLEDVEGEMQIVDAGLEVCGVDTCPAFALATHAPPSRKHAYDSISPTLTPDPFRSHLRLYTWMPMSSEGVQQRRVHSFYRPWHRGLCSYRPCRCHMAI
jgi:hypothetical protein